MRTKLVLLLLLIIGALGYSKYASTLKPVEVANEVDNDQIKVATPLPNETVTSPLIIKGAARGTWYFEASFPVYLYDETGQEIAVGYAQARSDWMTEDFVDFVATLEFEQTTTQNGTLVLKKDNPSGLPEFDDAVSIPVILSGQ